jgi:hypothetical protein
MMLNLKLLGRRAVLLEGDIVEALDRDRKTWLRLCFQNGKEQRLAALV